MKHNKFDWSSGSLPVIEAHSLFILETWAETKAKQGERNDCE